MNIDLHTHTLRSDGALSPTDLVNRAAERNVDVLSITDHDTVAGINEALGAAPEHMTIVPGIELSTNWRKIGVHVVGLGIDTNNEALSAGIHAQTEARGQRAQTIAERLSKLGFENTLEGAQQMAGSHPPGRAHFARYLVASSQIKDEKTAFRKVLGNGKAGDVRNLWAPLQDVIAWIHAAGGVAVLAHPMKYKLTNLKLEELAREFSEAGGDALEAISGWQDSGLTNRLARLGARHGLRTSAGSDFHAPGQYWADVGGTEKLPNIQASVLPALGIEA